MSTADLQPTSWTTKPWRHDAHGTIYHEHTDHRQFRFSLHFRYL
jgi:hypothetical protein